MSESRLLTPREAEAVIEARIERFGLGALPRVKVTELAYGENPHQRAAYYAESGARLHLLSRVEQLHGRELSYNNLNDLSAARELLEQAIDLFVDEVGKEVAGGLGAPRFHERAEVVDHRLRRGHGPDRYRGCQP